MNTHTLNGKTVYTSFDYPPIPDRRFDWSAIDDNYDGAPDAGWHCVGHGRTEQEAIADYLEQEAEREAHTLNAA